MHAASWNNVALGTNRILKIRLAKHITSKQESRIYK